MKGTYKNNDNNNKSGCSLTFESNLLIKDQLIHLLYIYYTFEYINFEWLENQVKIQTWRKIG